MAAITAQTSQTAGSAITAPPNPATLHRHLSAPGSRAFQDALRTLWRLGPTAIGLPETTAQPVRAAWQQAGEQMAAAIRKHEAPDPTDTPDWPSAESAPPSAPESKSASSVEPDHVLDIAANLEANTDLEDIWADVRARIERGKQDLPDPPSFNSFSDVQRAIDELRATLAQAPITLHDAVGSSDQEAAETANIGPGKLTHDPAEQLDEQLTAVDAAYADAQAAGIHSTRPEWARITAIHTAVHNLWDTAKAAAGTYWAELVADTRVHGLLTTLATHAARVIATLANTAAGHLEQRSAPRQLSVATELPGLRDAYINARNQIRAHAASHEWQRITALWGTVNTLARQTDDPGIRAVVARSADAISDHAGTLARKTNQYDHGDATAALKTLAAAAERHAASLRPSNHDYEPHGRPGQASAAISPARSLDDAPRAQRDSEAQTLQARARQVALHAQARLNQMPGKAAAAARRPHGANSHRSQGTTMQPTKPSPPRETAKMHLR